jgi:hypothetical protein
VPPSFNNSTASFRDIFSLSSKYNKVSFPQYSTGRNRS